jgi:RHS repeat-associated protein
VGNIVATDYGYTGQRNLDESIGLMDYKARFYSPFINRFIQPDSIVPDPTNPQSWNRYSYVVNNPILYNDPDGHCVPACPLPYIAVATFLVVGTFILYQASPQFRDSVDQVVANAGNVRLPLPTPEPKVKGWEKNESKFNGLIDNAGRTADNPDREPGSNGKRCNSSLAMKAYCWVVVPAFFISTAAYLIIKGAHNQDGANSYDPLKVETFTPEPTSTTTATGTPTSTPTVTPTATPTNTPTATPTSIPSNITNPIIIPVRRGIQIAY